MRAVLLVEKAITVDYNKHFRCYTMVMNLILISSKLVDIPKKADLGRNFAMQLY